MTYRVSLIDFEGGGHGKVASKALIEAGSSGEAVCIFIEQRDDQIRKLAARTDCSSYAFRVKEVTE